MNSCLIPFVTAFLLYLLQFNRLGNAAVTFPSQSCCSLRPKELKWMDQVFPNCTTHRKDSQIVSESTVCSSGSCFHNGNCVCASHFLASTSNTKECTSVTVSFHKKSSKQSRPLPTLKKLKDPFKTSSKQEDNFQNCCSLTQQQLENMKGRNENCPALGFISDLLESKCLPCPANMCRVNQQCYCPTYFMTKTGAYDPKGYCQYSFGERWPHSIGEEDKHWRSCSDEDGDASPSEKNCCSMTEDELEAMRGKNEFCPLINFASEVLGSKCLPCPANMCRVDQQCYCPTYFLTKTGAYDPKGYCVNSFGSRWPFSIGEEDKDWRGCESLASEPPTSTVSSRPSEEASKPPGESMSPIVSGNTQEPSLSASPAASLKVSSSPPASQMVSPSVSPGISREPSVSESPIASSQISSSPQESQKEIPSVSPSISSSPTLSAKDPDPTGNSSVPNDASSTGNDDEKNGNNKTLIIVLGSIGAVVGLLLIVGIVTWVVRRNS